MIETRLLHYFLVVAQEENITKAAQILHISQPTLSRQMKQLEEEIGQILFVRSNYSIKLTEEGLLLRKRAKEILELLDKTTKEIQAINPANKGTINIGAAETVSMKYLFRAISNIQKEYGDIQINLYSGNKELIMEKIEKGLIDIALVSGDVDVKKYHTFTIPQYDHWIVLMTRDHPLSGKPAISKEDLLSWPLICSRESLEKDLLVYFGDDYVRINLAGTYDLLYNASLMVKEHMGIALAYDDIVNTIGDATLCTKKLETPLVSVNHILIKKTDRMTPLMKRMLEEIQVILPLIENRH